MQSASMARKHTLPLVAAMLLASLAGCATTTTQQWRVSGSDREHAVVRVSFDYPEFHQPADNDAQALKIAASRCNSWGYVEAQPIEGQLRQCTNMNGANCDLRTV